MERIDSIYLFLKQVDDLFPVSLSRKQNLAAFAEKLCHKATLCIEEKNGEITAAVFGYTEHVTENRGYISIVATLPKYQGKGYAAKLVKEFLCIAREKQLEAVHLYAAPDNAVAVNMYKRIGFVEWKMPDEPRPEDLHLIYYLE